MAYKTAGQKGGGGDGGNAAAHSARCLRSSEHLLGGSTVPSPKYHSLGLPHGARVVARHSGALLCSSCH